MAIYLGYYRTTPEYAREAGQRARTGEVPQDPRFLRMVIDLPEKLPAGCRIVGAYATVAGNVLSDPGPPSLIIVETDNPQHCFFISQYYTGYLEFVWMPAVALGASRAERQAAISAAATPAGAAR